MKKLSLSVSKNYIYFDLEEAQHKSEGPVETKSSPLLLPTEKQAAVDAAHSLDSK